MIVRDVKSEDIQFIERLNSLQSDFKIHNFNNYIIDKLVFEGEAVIAYGIVKRMAEAIVLLDPNIPAITRTKALIELMKYAEMAAKRNDCEQLHVFVKDSRLVSMLENKFGFVKTKDIVLCKGL